MEYQKPVINLVADAIRAVQGHKPDGPTDNPPQSENTTNAYEADE